MQFFSSWKLLQNLCKERTDLSRPVAVESMVSFSSKFISERQFHYFNVPTEPGTTQLASIEA